MKQLILLSATVLAVWMMQSCGNNPNNSQSEKPTDSAQAVNDSMQTVDEKSSQFAVDAANAGMKEVALGKIAQEKGLNERVKAFGMMMVNDHTKAGDELKALADRKSIALPAELSTEDKNHIDDMAKKNGKAFDKAYIDMMVDGHNKVVDEFEKASDNVTDDDLKTWARNTLPTLKAHLDSAKAIKDALK